MITYILRYIFFSICFFGFYNTYATSSVDSLRIVIGALKGSEKIDALNSLCQELSATGDIAAENKAIHDYIREADAQKDKESAGHARAKSIFFYYNNGMKDSLEAALPKYLEFFQTNHMWDYYFNSRAAKVEMYQASGMPLSALNEAMKMYSFANENKLNYGIGVSCYNIGIAYYVTKNYTLAEKFLSRAVSVLIKEDDITILLSSFSQLTQVLENMKKYDAQLYYTEQWEKVLKDFQKNAEKHGGKINLSGRYLYCYASRASLFIEQGMLDSASVYVDKVVECAKGRKPIVQYKVRSLLSKYYQAKKDYPKALEYAEENLRHLDKNNLHTTELYAISNCAKLYHQNGNNAKAVELFELWGEKIDSMNIAQTTTQLNEFKTIYDVDFLKAENQIISQKIFIAVSICVFLVIILTLIIVYSFRLNRKNIALYQQIKRMDQTEEKAEKTQTYTQEDTHSKEKMLFKSISEKMVNDKLFTNPNIRRKDLSDTIGTNEVYLAEAIRVCTDGLTVGEYINRLRLKYACHLLSNSSFLSMDEICENAGFSSRSTYYRLFRQQYGMSPSEFRIIAQKTKDK
ncbi:MAG: helix-turn-helix domain-containing protein [Flavobacteriales bacterium]|nr:helix-turn-helix domain-containing protein [Flavobacteriales bacterium]